MAKCTIRMRTSINYQQDNTFIKFMNEAIQWVLTKLTSDANTVSSSYKIN